MKRFFSLALSILVVLLSQSCSPVSKTASPSDNLPGTIQALSIQATIQQGIIGTQNASNQGTGSKPTKSSTLVPPAGNATAAPAPASTTGSEMLASGTGLTDFTLTQYLPVYNLHVITPDGSWPAIETINLRNVAVKDWATGNGVLGERWFAITTPLPVGKYNVKSKGGTQWEIWNVATPPVSFSTKSTGKTLLAGVGDYFFQVERKGVYQIKMDVLSGGFVLYVGCGFTGLNNQNPRDLIVFNQAVAQSGSYETPLTPGMCFLEVANSGTGSDPQWKISVTDTGK